jgi:hypothetical protein
MRHTDRNHGWGGLVAGLVLLGLGVVFLLRELGVLTGSIFVSGWWALLVVVLGLAKAVRPRHAKDVGEGVTLALIGVWLYLAHTGYQGFSYHSTWPLVLVAVGAGMVARTIANRWLPDRRIWSREERHV